MNKIKSNDESLSNTLRQFYLNLTKIIKRGYSLSELHKHEEARAWQREFMN